MSEEANSGIRAPALLAALIRHANRLAQLGAETDQSESNDPDCIAVVAEPGSTVERAPALGVKTIGEREFWQSIRDES